MKLFKQKKPAPIEEISVHQLKRLQDENTEFILLDVRENFEVNISKIPGSHHIPMNQIPNRLEELNSKKDIIIYCKSGVRSASVCEYLINKNFKSLKNVKGGIKSWSIEIDPSIPLY